MMPDDAATHLNLWKKHLGAIPAEVWNKTGLEALILADKDLTEVSEAVGRLKKLLMLDLGHNRLTGLPDTIGDLERLTGFLYLHDNQLASLPRTFERLKRLRYLNLSENLFEELPEVACARKDWSSSVRRTSES
jgi:Leucine-rich repeat (LRR) protein